MSSFSVVIPVYNELDNIPLMYEQLNATLPQLGRDYEVIFVDDGSQDGSLEALRELTV